MRSPGPTLRGLGLNSLVLRVNASCFNLVFIWEHRERRKGLSLNDNHKGYFWFVFQTLGYPDKSHAQIRFFRWRPDASLVFFRMPRGGTSEPAKPRSILTADAPRPMGIGGIRGCLCRRQGSSSCLFQVVVFLVVPLKHTQKGIPSQQRPRWVGRRIREP